MTNLVLQNAHTSLPRFSWHMEKPFFFLIEIGTQVKRPYGTDGEQALLNALVFLQLRCFIHMQDNIEKRFMIYLGMMFTT